MPPGAHWLSIPTALGTWNYENQAISKSLDDDSKVSPRLLLMYGFSHERTPGMLKGFFWIFGIEK